MGATSQTGTGAGASFSGQKGPGNGRNVYVPMVSPHVVAAGSVALSGGTATVTFPTPLAGGKAKYVVMTTGETAATTNVTTKTDNGDDEFASFVITGTGTATVQWMVVTRGFGLLA